MRYDGSNLEEVLEENNKFIFTLEREGSPAIFSNMRVHDLEVPRAKLFDSVFKSFDCIGGNFNNMILSTATFTGAEFRAVDFSQTVIDNCRFLNAVFVDCNFEGADIYHSHFHRCTFMRCDFRLAKFTDAFFDLSEFIDVSNVPFIPMACPDTGAFIGWKKALCFSGFKEERKAVIVKLLIPDDAKRSSGLGRKCRCDKAIVLDVQDLDGTSLSDVNAMSLHNNSFGYIVGQTVTPEKPFDENRFNECASGIHFFVNREEAVRY